MGEVRFIKRFFSFLNLILGEIQVEGVNRTFQANPELPVACPHHLHPIPEQGGRVQGEAPDIRHGRSFQ